MFSGIPSLTILSEEQKFNGDDLLQWKTNMTQLLGSKGLLGYVDGSISKPTLPTVSMSQEATATAATVTPIYSTTPALDEWNFRDQLARGHITLNCVDLAGLGVTTSGTAKDAWDSIDAEWGRSTDMRRSHAQEVLNRIEYVEGTDKKDHIKLLRTQKAAVHNLCAQAMSDETWRGIIIRSIPPTSKWLTVIPSLYSMSTAADIFSTLLAHGMLLGRGTGKATTSATTQNMALAARVTDGCTNPNCKAKKRSSHITANCYWPGGGKEGQFPPNFGQRARANVAATTPAVPNTTSTPTPGQPEHFVLLANIHNSTPGQSGVVIDNIPSYPAPMALVSNLSKGFQDFQKGKVPTFLDSGASDTMFVSKDSFAEYKPVPERIGASAKANNGGFEIVGEGDATQRYNVNGSEQDITYTRALHAPTLNANLISVSALDKAGLTTVFGQGKGVTRLADGTIVLTGKAVNGMYILEDVETAPNVPLAMVSLSQAVSLGQWHRRLTHCSTSTIQDMANRRLVDGLNILGEKLSGKCEDCIMGRQTRGPFDRETEKDLLPLDLVSFDLWGPSRVQSIGGKLYLTIIVDAGTSYKFGAYLSDKSDSTTLAVLEIFRTKSEALTGRQICRLRTDGAFD